MKISTQSFPNIYHSELYREFERKAFKNGMIDKEKLVLNSAAEKISIKKQASVKTDFTPSCSLENDVLRLADGLRKKGYDENAEKIERNFVMFKKAESEFYNLKLESPEDFLNAAHDALDQGDLHFHTIQELKKQISLVSEKEAKGKESVASLAKKILKLGQEEVQEENSKPFQERFNTWNQYIDFLVQKVNELQVKGGSFFSLDKLSDKTDLQYLILLNGGDEKISKEVSDVYELYQIGGGKAPTPNVIVQNSEKIKEIVGGNFNYDVLNIPAATQKLKDSFAKHNLQEDAIQVVEDFGAANGIKTPDLHIPAIYMSFSFDNFVKQAAYAVASRIYNEIIKNTTTVSTYISKANSMLQNNAKQIMTSLSETKINMEKQADEYGRPYLDQASTLAKTAADNVLKIVKSNGFKYLGIIDSEDKSLSQDSLLNEVGIRKNDLLMGIAQVGGPTVDISDVIQKINEAIKSTSDLIEENVNGAKEQFNYLTSAKDALDKIPGSKNIKPQNSFNGFLSKLNYDKKTGKESLLKDLQDIINLNLKAK